ncbi:hypothetical protein IQ16_01745 [Bradyrhizobium huanghuaihaiense]|uniref:Uncharacterized protein n=1 Tax=Bradyrhizobium huanghuaihaiense TaxID=990078 RepID=A0A562RWX1_9BRAD|nr:hypothetical protein [Bradyrhizobium huanghuaihaiense]TWI73607.1 hypothetical protein IQ16_01745 [Bradyrhizobium huanghuaihaiense]
MSAAPSPENIMEALNDSGYLMEQEVATVLEGLGYHVQTNFPFEDIDEGKSREMDVRAIKTIARNEARKLSCVFEIIVECKNSSNPFVFIGRPKTAADQRLAPEEYVFFTRWYETHKPVGKGGSSVQLTEPFHHLGFPNVHYAYQRPEKAVQFCRVDRKGSGWHANHAGLYDAIFFPMAKAVSSRMKEIPREPRHDEWRYLWFFVPLVVVSSDIYWVDSMQQAPTPEVRPYVTFRRQLRSKTLNGSFSVDFVRQDYLAWFDTACLGRIAEHAAMLVNEEPDLVLKKEIAWDDAR